MGVSGHVDRTGDLPDGPRVAIPAQAVSQQSRPFWRGVAMLAAGLIVFLLIASVSPVVHGWCCEHGHATAAAPEAECVVFCFAGGLVSALGAVTAPAPVLFALDTVGVRAGDLALPSPVWRMPPACGPPAAV